ncbi:hypothetical protein Scep_017507 [Stephania cephalantha]|uniref:Uncharacterized protein n=1 Tax=Stephania cephalantha TaxID=152367 RepID=A0AAP0IPK3_9MAGN
MGGGERVTACDIAGTSTEAFLDFTLHFTPALPSKSREVQLQQEASLKCRYPNRLP